MFEYRNIVEPFLSNVQAIPDRIAAVYDNTELTYRELDELSMRIACVFRDRGIRPGDRVAYLLPNRIELIGVYLAIERMGAVAVPLNFRLIPREIAFLTKSVDARMLVFDQRFLDRVRILSNTQLAPYYQQAVISYTLRDPNILSQFPTIEKNMSLTRFQTFVREAQMYLSDMPRGEKELKAEWLNYYPYYLYFENLQTSTSTHSNEKEKAGVN